jgi:transcription termination factor NusB
MVRIEQGPRRERQPNREELIRLFTSLIRETIRITNEIISKALEELDPLLSQKDPHEAFSDFNDFMRLIEERVSKLDESIRSVLKVKRLFPKDQALRDLAFELKQARLLLKGTVETLRAAFKQRIKEQRLRKLERGMR